MSSFIAETLEASGMRDGERCAPDLTKLAAQSDEIKVEIMSFLNSEYEDFDGWLDKTCVLHKRWEQLNSTLTSTTTLMRSELKAQENASSAYSGVAGELEKVTDTLSILDRLLEVHRLHQSINDQLSCHDFYQTSKELKKMRLVLDQLESSPHELDITKALKVELTMLTETLKHSMTEEWNKLVKVSKPDLQTSNSSKDDSDITFSIQSGKSKSHLAEISQALHSEGMLKMRLRPLSDALKLAFDWIVNHPKTTVNEESKDSGITITVHKTTQSVSASWPSSVFKLLYRLVKPLAQHLLSLSMEEDSKLTLMLEFRDVCGTGPIDTVVKGCLAPSVPTSQSDLDKYKDVLTDTEKVEDFFRKIGFIAPDCKTMTNYMGNLNVLFANKKCQQILSRARELMKADLYNTVELKPGDDCANWAEFVARPETQQDTPDPQSAAGIKTQINRLSENTLKFPSCTISGTTVDLMKLAHDMLEEAASSTNAACCSQIVYAVRSMFELYTSVVSDYHRQSLESLPQVTALYYNNCMFLSHQLIMLANQYKARLAKIMSDGSAVTFVDLVPLLRALGTEAFLDQIQNQRENLLDCLRTAEGFKNMEVEERFQNAHQSVKQCIHQLNHLKKVWLNILPFSNYCKSIGHLLSCVVKELITSVTSLEDMSADDTTKLHCLITEIQTAAPDLFPGDKSSALGYLHKHTGSWTRLNELGLILTASLHDIVDRWAESKGPLAAEFSSEQVKSLIRALFQNTERRAAALAKIR